MPRRPRRSTRARSYGGSSRSASIRSNIGCDWSTAAISTSRARASAATHPAAPGRAGRSGGGRPPAESAASDPRALVQLLGLREGTTSSPRAWISSSGFEPIARPSVFDVVDCRAMSPVPWRLDPHLGQRAAFRRRPAVEHPGHVLRQHPTPRPGRWQPRPRRRRDSAARWIASRPPMLGSRACSSGLASTSGRSGQPVRQRRRRRRSRSLPGVPRSCRGRGCQMSNATNPVCDGCAGVVGVILLARAGTMKHHHGRLKGSLRRGGHPQTNQAMPFSSTGTGGWGGVDSNYTRVRPPPKLVLRACGARQAILGFAFSRTVLRACGARQAIMSRAVWRLPLSATRTPSASRINERGNLETGGCDVTDVAERFGMPGVRVRQGRHARPRPVLHGGVPGTHGRLRGHLCLQGAALSQRPTGVLAEEGLSVDVASGGELYLALQGGRRPAADLHARQQQDRGGAEDMRSSPASVTSSWIRSLKFSERGLSGPLPDVLIRVTPGIKPSTHTFRADRAARSRVSASACKDGQAAEAVLLFSYVLPVRTWSASTRTSDRKYFEAPAVHPHDRAAGRLHRLRLPVAERGRRSGHRLTRPRTSRPRSTTTSTSRCAPCRRPSTRCRGS